MSPLNDMINYDCRRFQSVSNSEGGDVGNETVFTYRQQGDLLWGEYYGGKIRRGNLVGKVDNIGNLEFIYQHVTVEGQLKSGYCKSTPEILPDFRLRLYEKWRWIDGDQSDGESVIEEIGFQGLGT